MDDTHGATTCRWAIPTLFLSEPLWLDAWNYPWSCLRDPTPRILHTTDVCTLCPRWEAHPAHKRPETDAVGAGLISGQARPRAE